MSKYVLITAARNEQEYIERTIHSVTRQSVLPLKWIIVSDGSTDNTETIVKDYALSFPFIELVTTSGDKKRNFGSKAKSVNFGYERVRGLAFDYVGNVDADIAFDSHYYQRLLQKFHEYGRLGLGGGIRYDWSGGRFVRVRCAPDSVGGPFQFFRRQCFETIGGYHPLPYGGIDTVAEVMVRMRGWEVRSFPDLIVYHYRQTGQARGNILINRFYNGFRDYLVGYDPLFQLLRCLRSLSDRPFVFGALAWWIGFLYPWFKGWDRPLPKDFVKYLRNEQQKKLYSFLTTSLKIL